MQKIIYKNEIQNYSNEIDQSIIDYINNESIETFESFENYDLIAFNWLDLKNNYKKRFKAGIYIDKDDLFYIVDNEATFHAISEYVVESDSNEHALYLFFRNILKGNNKFLEDLETKIAELENEVSNKPNETIRFKIGKYRNQILSLKRYYEQLEFLFDELCDNDNNIYSNKYIKYFEVLHNRVTRFVSYVTSLRDYLSQIREAYQGEISIEQNNLMKVFTIVTSIFLPLTLIVGWYGMNLKMPEFQWQYGYPFVIILSLIVSLSWFILFKCKRWFK